MSLGLTMDSTPDQVAAAIIREAVRRRYSHPEAVASDSAARQESSLNPRAVSANGKWKNIYQQDSGYKGRDDPNTAIIEFFDRLDVKRRSPGASTDPFKNIFWLQQRPSDPSADAAFNHPKARRAYYDEIRRHIAAAEEDYAKYAGAAPTTAAPSAGPAGYGLPRGINIDPGEPGFPEWVYRIANHFGVKAATYPGHQETNRAEAGYAANPQNLNRGIDWSAPMNADGIARMQRLAEYFMSIRGELEQLIWENPNTGQRIGVAGGKDIGRGYYEGEWARHRNHNHTRQSRALTVPGSAPAPAPAPVKVENFGDPLWLPDVLRAEGLIVREIDGWRNRGHGDFGEIRGIVVHHTGSNNASAESIAFHPTLGLASQLHLARDGVWTICGVGIAWHAGSGGGIPWLPNNDANRYTIGIEAANDGGGSPGKPHRSSWPDVQYDSYVRGCAAILRKIGQAA